MIPYKMLFFKDLPQIPTAAAKSLQSCLTLCNPRDGSHVNMIEQEGRHKLLRILIPLLQYLVGLSS